MLISVVNYSTLSDEDVQIAIRAVNRQIAEDFAPYWGFGGKLRLEGGVGRVPDQQNLSELRGDAMLYLYDNTDPQGALGSHGQSARGVPYGFVFADLCLRLGDPWSMTLSHEALELLADPRGNLLARGPHPGDPTREVFHWFEMCDAVQNEWYWVDGCKVSNFVLPSYFTPGEELAGRNDFLGRKDANGNGLLSFGTNPGGYIGFYDPQINGTASWHGAQDTRASLRMMHKQAAGAGRAQLRR
jgi:hypothetical protein